METPKEAEPKVDTFGSAPFFVYKKVVRKLTTQKGFIWLTLKLNVTCHEQPY